MTFSSWRGVVVAAAVVLASGQARAASISGTFGASFQGFNEFGVPSVKLDLTLMCSLVCPVSAPELRFSCAGGVGGKFVAAPMETAGYTSAFFGSNATGINSTTSTSFPVGSAFYVEAKSATCWCGNATGQGGYIDLQTPTVAIPPRLLLLDSAQVGDDVRINVYARPMGSDTVDVRVQGAGLDEVRTVPATQFGTSTSNGSTQVIVKPTQAGTLTVTATLQPYGAVSTAATMAITGGSASTGGGTGSTGGGSGSNGGGGGASEPGGCSSAPGLLIAAALVLLGRRRA